MNKSLTQALGFCAALLMLVTACKKDEVRVTLTPSNTPTLATTTTTAVLVQANAAQTAATFTWTPVKSLNMSDNSTTLVPAITYYLQFDKAGNNFNSPVSIAAGAASATGATSTTVVTVGSLNNALTTLGLTPGMATDVEVRLNASYAANSATYSNSVPLKVTSYKACPQPANTANWSIIGAAALGWSTDVYMTYDCDTNSYSYTGTFGADEYKFRFGSDWKANLGGNTSTGGALTQDGSNLKIATAGTYTITLKPAAIDATTGKVAAGSTFTIK